MARKSRNLALAVALVAGCGPAGGSQTEGGWGDALVMGPYPVGFATESLTRRVEGGGTRRLQLSIWYPGSAKRPNRQLTVGDLFGLLVAERQFPEVDGMPADRAFPAVMTGDSSAISTQGSTIALARTTAALVGAPPAAGSFPLVLLTSRHATILAQAPLAETLASRGLVVATVWSSDPPLAFIWEERSEADKLATIDVQTDDLIFALGTLGQRPWVDTSRIVAAAWSYGGQTAARLQERIDAVRMVVSLDANVVPARSEERLSLRRPLVTFAGRDTTRRGFDRLAGLTAPLVVVRVPGMSHGEFNALEGYLPALFAADTAYSWSRKGTGALEAYRVVVTLVSEAVALAMTDDGPTAEVVADRLRRMEPSMPVDIRAQDGPLRAEPTPPNRLKIGWVTPQSHPLLH